MTIKNIFYVMLLSNLLVAGVQADNHSSTENLKYYVIEAKPKPEVFKILIENPTDPSAAARKFIKHIEGAKLVDYYMKVGTPNNLAIIVVPNSMDAATILYQRIATDLIDEIEIYKVMRGDQFADVLKAAKELDQHNSYKKK